MELAQSIAHYLASMAGAVVVLTAIAVSGAWVMTRKQTCNPYGYNACACGCGTDCED